MKYNDLSLLLEQPVASSWIEDLTFIEDAEELEVADSSEEDIIDVSEIDDDEIEDEGYEVITIGGDDFDEEEFGYAFGDDDDEGLSLDFAFDSDDEDADEGGVLMTVKTGKTYYIPMPFEVYQKWLKASSKGKFWWSDVKGIYT